MNAQGWGSLFAAAHSSHLTNVSVLRKSGSGYPTWSIDVGLEADRIAFVCGLSRGGSFQKIRILE